MKKLILLCILLTGCTVSQTDLKKANAFCSDKEGIFMLYFDAWATVVQCKNSQTIHTNDVK